MDLRSIVTRIYDTTKLLPVGEAADYHISTVVDTPFLNVILIKPGRAGTKPFMSRQLATDLKQVAALGDREEIVIDVRHGFVAIQVPKPPAERGKVVYTPRQLPRSRGLRVVLGLDVMNQPLSFDFAGQMNTNLSFLGVPGSGKSVLMRGVNANLAANNDPQSVKFLMIEVAKDGLDLRIFGQLPHLVHPVITDPAEAEAALGWAVTKLTEGLDHRLFIVIDEVAALVSQRPATVPLLMSLVSQGRAMGIVNLLATQLSDRDTLAEGKAVFKQIHNVVLGKAGNAQLSYVLGNKSGLNAESLLGQGDLLLSSNDQTARFAGVFTTREDILSLPRVDSIPRLSLGHYTNTEAVIEYEKKPGPDPSPTPPDVVIAGLQSLQRQIDDPKYRQRLAGKKFYVMPTTEVEALGRNMIAFRDRDQVYITNIFKAMWRKGLRLCSKN